MYQKSAAQQYRYNRLEVDTKPRPKQTVPASEVERERNIQAGKQQAAKRILTPLLISLILRGG